MKRKWHDLVSMKECARQREMRGAGGGGPVPSRTEVEEKVGLIDLNKMSFYLSYAFMVSSNLCKHFLHS